MVMNDIEFDFLSSIKDEISQIHLFWDSYDDDLWKYVDEKKWNDNQKSKYNNLSGKKFIENRYKLLKEKKLEKVYKITSFTMWNKPFDVFKKWYENLYDLKIVWISKRDDGSYQIVVDVWYKWKYKDAKLWTWHKNYYDLQCIPGETDTWYYKRIVVYKRIVNENWIKKLKTIKVNLEQTLALPYNFKGKISFTNHDSYWYTKFNYNSNLLDYNDNESLLEDYEKVNDKNSLYNRLNKLMQCSKSEDVYCNYILVDTTLTPTGRDDGPRSYLEAIRKGKDFVLAFIKYTYWDSRSLDPSFGASKNDYDKLINTQKQYNIVSNLMYFDFKRNKKYSFAFNIAKYACDLWYDKFYFSLEKSDYLDDSYIEFPSYKWKYYKIYDSIAKAVNNWPEDYLKNAFSSYFK